MNTPDYTELETILTIFRAIEKCLPGLSEPIAFEYWRQACNEVAQKMKGETWWLVNKDGKILQA